MNQWDLSWKAQCLECGKKPIYFEDLEIVEDFFGNITNVKHECGSDYKSGSLKPYNEGKHRKNKDKYKKKTLDDF